MQLLLQRALFLMPQLFFGSYLLGICQIRLYHGLGLPKISPCQPNHNSFQDPLCEELISTCRCAWVKLRDVWVSVITSLAASKFQCCSIQVHKNSKV